MGVHAVHEIANALLRRPHLTRLIPKRTRESRNNRALVDICGLQTVFVQVACEKLFCRRTQNYRRMKSTCEIGVERIGELLERHVDLLDLLHEPSATCWLTNERDFPVPGARGCEVRHRSATMGLTKSQ